MLGTVANRRVRVRVRGGSRWLSCRNLAPAKFQRFHFLFVFSGATRNVNFDMKSKFEILATFKNLRRKRRKNNEVNMSRSLFGSPATGAHWCPVQPF